MSAIFICYRRGDSAGHAGRLFDHLVEEYGPERVFMDVGSITPGTDFVREIERRVAACTHLLAVIGPNWLVAASGDTAPRLFAEDDYVRMEISRALHGDIRVIPVMVNGAGPPTEHSLPKDLADLARRQAFKIDDDGFGADVARLIAAIGPAPHPTTPSVAGTGPAKPARSPRVGLVALLVSMMLATGVIATVVSRRHSVNPTAGQAPVPRAPDIQTLLERARRVARNYHEELLTRFGTDGWLRVEVDVPGKDPWAQAQAVAAVASMPSSVAMFDSVLKEPIDVLLQTRGKDGWSGGDFHKYPHVEPVIWTGLAFARLAGSGTKVDLPDRQWLWELLADYRRGRLWHEFPKAVQSKPSVYATAMGLVLLVDNHVGTRSTDQAARRDIEQTAQDLVSQARYHESDLLGWPSEIGAPNESFGVSLLTAYALLHVQRELGIEVARPLASELPKLLTRVWPFSFDQNDGYYFLGGRAPDLINHHVRITWSPWALAAALEWTRTFADAASPADRQAVLKVIAGLLSSAEAQNVRTTYAFLLAEHVFVLGETESANPAP
jgi:hypothetical protein